MMASTRSCRRDSEDIRTRGRFDVVHRQSHAWLLAYCECIRKLCYDAKGGVERSYEAGTQLHLPMLPTRHRHRLDRAIQNPPLTCREDVVMVTEPEPETEGAVCTTSANLGVPCLPQKSSPSDDLSPFSSFPTFERRYLHLPPQLWCVSPGPVFLPVRSRCNA